MTVLDDAIDLLERFSEITIAISQRTPEYSFAETRSEINHIVKKLIELNILLDQEISKAKKRVLTMININECEWKVEGGQFCGGFWYETSCGQIEDINKEVPEMCPYCHKPVINVDELKVISGV